MLLRIKIQKEVKYMNGLIRYGKKGVVNENKEAFLTRQSISSKVRGIRLGKLMWEASFAYEGGILGVKEHADRS